MTCRLDRITSSALPFGHFGPLNGWANLLTDGREESENNAIAGIGNNRPRAKDLLEGAEQDRRQTAVQADPPGQNTVLAAPPVPPAMRSSANAGTAGRIFARLLSACGNEQKSKPPHYNGNARYWSGES